MDSFTEFVHGLPQEIFDHIKNLVFTAGYATVLVDASYKPPHLLTISKSTRQQYAESYYGEGTTFIFQESRLLFKTLTTLSIPHQKLIKAIEVIVAPLPKFMSHSQSHRVEWARVEAENLLSLEDAEDEAKRSIEGVLREKKIQLSDGILDIVYHPYEPEDTSWTTRAFFAVENFAHEMRMEARAWRYYQDFLVERERAYADTLHFTASMEQAMHASARNT